MNLVDIYDFRARVVPALLCVLPAPLALWCFYGDKANWWGSGITLAVSFGFVYLLSRVSRNAGVKMQDQLFRDWGGPPAEQLLRHRNARIDPHSKAKLHQRLEKCCGVAFPSAAQEATDRVGAEDAYRAGVRWLLNNTRDTKKYSLVFKENINFGFQRNALGLRWIGATIAFLSAGIILISAGVVNNVSPFFHVSAVASVTPAMALSLLISLAMLAIWLFAITPEAARHTAFAYADRLIEAADSFE